MCVFVEKAGGANALMKLKTEKIREDLLAIKGIGKETADTILLYAIDEPQFIIDEYAKRCVALNHLVAYTDYDELQDYFQSSIKPSVELYQNLHALIIISQRGREKSGMEIV